MVAHFFLEIPNLFRKQFAQSACVFPCRIPPDSPARAAIRQSVRKSTSSLPQSLSPRPAQKNRSVIICCLCHLNHRFRQKLFIHKLVLRCLIRVAQYLSGCRHGKSRNLRLQLLHGFSRSRSIDLCALAIIFCASASAASIRLSTSACALFLAFFNDLRRFLMRLL